MCMKPQTMMGNVIVAVIVASLTGTLGWIAVQSSYVPSIKVELSHLSKTIDGMSGVMEKFEKSNRDSQKQIIGVINSHGYKIKSLNRDCDEFRKMKYKGDEK